MGFRGLCRCQRQIERLGTVFLMVLVGGLLTRYFLPASALWFMPLLLIVIRPLAAWMSRPRAAKSAERIDGAIWTFTG